MTATLRGYWLLGAIMLGAVLVASLVGVQVRVAAAGAGILLASFVVVRVIQVLEETHVLLRRINDRQR